MFGSRLEVNGFPLNSDFTVPFAKKLSASDQLYLPISRREDHLLGYAGRSSSLHSLLSIIAGLRSFLTLNPALMKKFSLKIMSDRE